MTFYEEAVRLDIHQDFAMAARAYEKANEESHVPVDSYINLACLYWLSSEFGAAVSPEFRHLSGQRMNEVIDEACERYGDMPELLFWRLYFAYMDLGADAFLDKALDLVQRPNTTIVPYLYIYTTTQNPVYLSHVHMLIEMARRQLTSKNRYILSMLDRDDEPMS